MEEIITVYHGSNIIVEVPEIRPVNRPMDFDAITLYESGIISRADLILRLRTKKLNDQLCFCTQNALSCLEFVGG